MLSRLAEFCPTSVLRGRKRCSPLLKIRPGRQLEDHISPRRLESPGYTCTPHRLPAIWSNVILANNLWLSLSPTLLGSIQQPAPCMGVRKLDSWWSFTHVVSCVLDCCLTWRGNMHSFRTLSALTSSSALIPHYVCLTEGYWLVRFVPEQIKHVCCLEFRPVSLMLTIYLFFLVPSGTYSLETPGLLAFSETFLSIPVPYMSLNV